jgi:hypothetical protein
LKKERFFKTRWGVPAIGFSYQKGSYYHYYEPGKPLDATELYINNDHHVVFGGEDD